MKSSSNNGFGNLSSIAIWIGVRTTDEDMFEIIMQNCIFRIVGDGFLILFRVYLESKKVPYSLMEAVYWRN